MEISPARRAAFDILRRVEEDNAYASALLATGDDRLRDDDRALCHELVLGVLRRRLWLDRTLEHLADRSVEGLDLAVRLALRIGLYQLRFLSRIPPSAAVNESVNLVRAARLKSAASFTNAVLRRATREPDYDPTANTPDSIEKLSIETSHPRWLIERWCSQFGFEEAALLARSNNRPAPLAFRFTARAFVQNLNRASAIADDLRKDGAELLPSRIAQDSWRIVAAPGKTRERIRKLSQDGLIYFQDEGSQLVAHLLSARSGDRVLDVCAAPGSKSTLIAALAPQAAIIAGDLYEHRLRTIKEVAMRQGADNVRLLAHDATRELPYSDGTFDRVLVDAPCSGTGTLRRNPEIRWKLQPSDIVELAAKQRRILEKAAAMVRPGGVLLYSTCSVETDENEPVVSDFLSETTESRLFSLPQGEGNGEGLVRRG